MPENNRPIVHCDRCACETPTDELTDVAQLAPARSARYCAECVSDWTSTCDRCNTIARSETMRDVDGNVWCASCVESNAGLCNVCGNLYPDTYIRTVTHTFRNGRNVCDTCASSHGYFECEQCGEFCHSDSYAGDGYCDQCYSHDDEDDDDCDQYDSGSIGDYHSTRRRGFAPIEFPYPYSRRAGILYSSRSSPKLLFGVELEIERGHGRDALTPSQIAQRAKNQLGALFAGGERDGSLRDGVEIITHPATIDAHRQAWRNFDLRGTRAVSHDAPGSTCGLHIHFTRAAVSSLTIAKLVALFGHEESEKAWCRVFRRNLNSYALACRKPRISAGARLSASRYESVNTTGAHTVEIRWAKGTLQARTVVATLEIVHAAIRYCENASVQALTASAFLAWICRDPWARSETTTARRYLIDRGLVSSTMDPSARVRPGIASLPAALSDDAPPIPDATPHRPGDAEFAAAAAAGAYASARHRRLSAGVALDPVVGIAPTLAP